MCTLCAINVLTKIYNEKSISNSDALHYIIITKKQIEIRVYSGSLKGARDSGILQYEPGSILRQYIVKSMMAHFSLSLNSTDHERDFGAGI